MIHLHHQIKQYAKTEHQTYNGDMKYSQCSQTCYEKIKTTHA